MTDANQADMQYDTAKLERSTGRGERLRLKVIDGIAVAGRNYL